jgi:hypothetical protein
LIGNTFNCKVGYQASHEARQKLPTEEDSPSFYYGEIRFRTFATALHKCKTKYGGWSSLSGDDVFYDLGSGMGKVVVAASLLHPFQQSIGIEYLDHLHIKSQELLARFRATTAATTTTRTLTMRGDICNERVRKAYFVHYYVYF